MNLNKTASIFSILAIFSLAPAAFSATANYKCDPVSSNDYFTDTVILQVVSAKQIKINHALLTLDSAYHPRYPTSFKHYVGDTETASGWGDSGEVEVFFDGSKRLKFTVRGEMYISNQFNCKLN